MTPGKSPPIYEQIGEGYAAQRRPDPRWAKEIHGALASDSTVLNVGAGTGSYEPADRMVIALEPSAVMIVQRSPHGPPVVQGRAEQLPFPDESFDACLAVLTVHHWDDPDAGLAEMCRVAARQVVVTWDQNFFASQFWLVRDYLKEAAIREQGLATLSTVQRCLHDAVCTPLLVPFDCVDGFFAAYWRRPEAYLDPRIRQATSGFSLLDPRVVEKAMKHLGSDIDDGTWHSRYSHLTSLDEIDLGFRLVVANS